MVGCSCSKSYFFIHCRFKLSFTRVLPKVLPFCRHHTVPFRLAAIETVMKIIEASQVIRFTRDLLRFSSVCVRFSLK